MQPRATVASSSRIWGRLTMSGVQERKPLLKKL
jgi:hypothetical protein